MFRLVVQKIKYFLENIYVSFCNLFFRRDKNVVLVGAWMGEKFADNSRYLYQYLYENISELGLKKVIWVTRNESLNSLLNEIGYESYLIGTKESRYWHLKAGVHILCNMAFPSNRYATDIDTRYSWGAVKFQLWHGLAIKSVGGASNEARRLNSQRRKVVQKIFHDSILSNIMSCGGWNDAYFLSTSMINLKANQMMANCKEDRLFISSYPRNCDCVRLLVSEEEAICKIRDYAGSILYLPTFRSDHSEYVHPLENEVICQFLQDNNYVWIEKPHPASEYSFDNHGKVNNVMLLDANYDINVLLPHIDMVVSDYSSVVFDAVYNDIPVIMYTPDLENFKNGDVGFMFDIESYCENVIAMSIEKCLIIINEIKEDSYFTEKRLAFYSKMKADFYDNREAKYEQIWSDICKFVK